MMKRLLCLIISILMILSLTACNNNNNPQPTIKPAGTLAEFEVSAYLIDEWKDVDENNATTQYNYILLVYTDGYYSNIEIDDVKFADNNERKVLTDVVDGATVKVFNANENTKNGTCAYVQISTPTLINTRNVGILVEGPKKYESDVSTKAEYEKKHGTSDGWYATLTSITTHIPSYQDIELACKSETSGIMRLFDRGRTQYWYDVVSPATTKGHQITIELNVVPLKNTTIDDFIQGFMDGCYFVNINDDGTFKEVWIEDENVEFTVETNGDNVQLIVRLIDGSNIADYTGVLPEAIIYNNNYLSHLFPLS